MTNTVDNFQDIIDSRDIIERIEELEDDDFRDDTDNEELAALKSLQEEAEGYSEDWVYGATLIRDSYFKTYAQDFADDIGAVNRDSAWPNSCIDWDQAASELQEDYTSVEFDGVTYWVR